MKLHDSEPVPYPTCENLRSVIRDLNESRESERIALHRALHDEVSGLIVSAGMDLAAVAQDLEKPGPVDPRLDRARKSMMAALDRNRQLTEELRPSLLDNFGLFTALRWYIKQGCAGSSAVCTEHYPENEMNLTAAATTGLYRIARELLVLVLSEPNLRALDLDVRIDDDVMQMTLTHEHAGPEPIDLFGERSASMHGLAERTRTLTGEMRVGRTPTGTAIIHRFALDQIT